MDTYQIIAEAKQQLSSIIADCERRLAKGFDNGDASTLKQAKDVLATLNKVR